MLASSGSEERKGDANGPQDQPQQLKEQYDLEEDEGIIPVVAEIIDVTGSKQV